MLPENVIIFIKDKLSVTSSNNITETALTDGRSGAQVYRIKVVSRKKHFTGNHIMKLCDIEDGEAESEIDKARQFCDYAPGFAGHLVKVEAEGTVDGKNVIIYSQANNQVRDTTAFASLDEEHVGKYMRQVSCDLLDVLNEEFETIGLQDGESVSEFFQCLIGRQLGEHGRFAQRIKDLLEEPDAQSVVLNGKVYPNPLYFMTHMDRWSGKMADQIFFRGAVHGDLHGNNLLATDGTYSIIDFDSASTNSFLFFDHAYFEFSVFYDNSKDNDLNRWNSMLEHLVAPPLTQEAQPCQYYMEYKVRNAVCGGVADWMHKRGQENSTDDIMLQFMLARIAAGINFFSKKSCAQRGQQLKVLLYIAYCIQLVLDKIGYVYDTDAPTCLLDADVAAETVQLWEDLVKFTNYIPVLITDDAYTIQEIGQLGSICAMNWAMVVDIGSEQCEPRMYKLFLENCVKRSVKKISPVAEEKAETFRSTLNIVSIRKAEIGSYRGLWREHSKSVLEALKKLCSENPKVPLLFVFDCGRDSQSFRDQMINRMCESDCGLPRGTRFMALRSGFTRDQKDEIPELEEKWNWHFGEYSGSNLLHIAQTCRDYLNIPERSGRCANLPALKGICTFQEKDLISFEASVELVYTGCESPDPRGSQTMDSALHSNGDSLGEAFYKGNEISWRDLAEYRDLPLYAEKRYAKDLDKLVKLAEEKTPHVKITSLYHGAGSGGTTLSKRILWDLKEQLPCARLKQYSSRTADILLEIYQRTGKCVLLSVESGSTVITDEELNTLKQKIDAENGRIMILLVKRMDNSGKDSQEEKEDKVFPALSDTMPITTAQNFLRVFSQFALQREEGGERKRWLEKITGLDEYINQRSPFFYGFYSFQEEYQLINSLAKTISSCDDQEKLLLNSLAVVTVFSQNIGVNIHELLMILEQKQVEDKISSYLVRELLPPALSKLMVLRNEKFRLCHKVIAEKILVLLHAADKPGATLETVVYKASETYIRTMSGLYNSEDEYVNTILKELIIDRAYIDSEERKTKFSILVETIPRWTDRERLFNLLIQLFPENPHYYNHLARLLATGDKQYGMLPQYEKAEQMAKEAIERAASGKNTHKTTLGCIYGQWILNDIREQTKSKKNGRRSSSYDELISDFSVRYKAADSMFREARQEAHVRDTFSYFPQIKMECDIIRHLIQFDVNRELGQLLKQEESFRKWYDDHFSLAVSLYREMKDQMGDGSQLLLEARNRLEDITTDLGDKINKRFMELQNSEKPSDRSRSRSLIYTVFSFNGCSWKNTDPETLRLAERCAYKNLLIQDSRYSQSDVKTWFELYRRLKSFQAADALAIIGDYMEEGVWKKYLQFILTFLLRKDSLSAASSETVIRLINDMKRLAFSQGLNTARERDAFMGVFPGITGCPVVSVADLPRDEKRDPIYLETFYGTVTEVGQTHGKILLDKLNLEATLTPKPQSAGDDPARIFTRNDINQRVKLNIMFSYSGLRAWKPVKI